MNGHHSPSVRLALRITLALSLVAGPVLSGRSLADPAQTQVDALVQQVENSAQQAGMPVTLTIDHARLAEQAGSPMEPATVVMVRQTELESRWLRANPNLALELPLRVLAHQTESHPSVRVSHQEGAALLARHGLSDPALAATYDRAVAALLQPVPAARVQAVPARPVEGDGVVNLTSPWDRATTRERVLAIIWAQSDTVLFDELTLQSASKSGEQPYSLTLILFGGPGPGGRAMAGSTLLGLDAFCQKLLILQNANSAIQVRFNDLTWIARRQGVPVSPVLQAINARLINTFREELAARNPTP